MTFRLLQVVSVVVLMLTSCSSSIDPTLIEPGISKELAELRIMQLTKVHYKLTFDIPESKSETIEAQMELGFELDRTLGQPVIIDFNVPEGAIRSVTSDNRPLQYRHQQEHIILELDDLADGYNIISIDFTAGEIGLNRQDEFIYTLFVPDRASTIFPCFDQPDLKATYELSLLLPEEWTPVSNAPLASKSDLQDKNMFQFERSDLMSTYLFSFAAGMFDSITDDSGKYPMTMYHREPDSIKLARNVKDIFHIHQQSLEWLEKYTSIDFPFQKFDFILIPGFQYGGMEHVGAIQYRASSLLLDESASTNRLLGRANLIAHETAHMWFGDLVTMRWFDDVWLKEVFANFMAAKIVNPLFPEIDHEQRFLLTHYPRAYSVDRTLGTHPIKQPLENLKQAGSLYGAIIYQKAPIVMKKLEQIMGENNFRLGIREYLKSYTNSAADWHDLITILDNKSAMDLSRWSHVWVETAGMPVIKTMFYEGTSDFFLRFEQKDPLDSGRTWPQSFSVNFNFDDGYLNRPARFNDQPVIEIAHSKDTKLPLSVEASVEGQLYGILDFADKPNMANFPYGYTMLNINLKENALSRASYYIQMHEFLLHKRAYPPSYPLLIERYLYMEQDQLNIELLLTYLRELYWQWMPGEQRAQYLEKYEVLLNQLMLQTDEPRLKSTIFKALINIASSDEQIAELLGIWRGQAPPLGITLSSRDYGDLAFELALRLPEEAADILETQLERITNSDEKQRFDFISKALDSGANARNAFFGDLLLAENRNVEPWVGTALHYLHHPLRASESVQYLRASLDILEEIQLTGDIFFPKRWLDQTFWGHQSAEARDIVTNFLSENPNYNPRLKNKILQSTDMLFRVVDMHDHMQKPL